MGKSAVDIREHDRHGEIVIGSNGLEPRILRRPQELKAEFCVSLGAFEQTSFCFHLADENMERGGNVMLTELARV